MPPAWVVCCISWRLHPRGPCPVSAGTRWHKQCSRMQAPTAGMWQGAGLGSMGAGHACGTACLRCLKAALPQGTKPGGWQPPARASGCAAHLCIRVMLHHPVQPGRAAVHGHAAGPAVACGSSLAAPADMAAAWLQRVVLVAARAVTGRQLAALRLPHGLASGWGAVGGR
jgi:hypothetical protein